MLSLRLKWSKSSSDELRTSLWRLGTFLAGRVSRRCPKKRPIWAHNLLIDFYDLCRMKLESYSWLKGRRYKSGREQCLVPRVMPQITQTLVAAPRPGLRTIGIQLWGLSRHPLDNENLLKWVKHHLIHQGKGPTMVSRRRVFELAGVNSRNLGTGYFVVGSWSQGGELAFWG